MNAIRSALVVCLLSALAMPAGADVIILGQRTDHDLVPDGNLADVRVRVGLVVEDGVATFTFENVSTGSETSAVIKEIVFRTYGPNGTMLLWDGDVLTHTSDVSYDLVASNGLPGYPELDDPDHDLAELQADAPPTRKGLGIGESLQVQFDTSLADGTTIEQFLAGFQVCPDHTYVMGFHAISASVVNGESLSGAVPEPGTLALLAAATPLAALRRRLRLRR